MDKCQKALNAVTVLWVEFWRLAFLMIILDPFAVEEAITIRFPIVLDFRLTAFSSFKKSLVDNILQNGIKEEIIPKNGVLS